MYNNIITVSSSKKREGKASGLKSILSLSQDLVDFQDKVSARLDDQLSGEYLALVEELEDQLVCFNKKLLDLAASQMQSSNRNEIALDDSEIDSVEEDQLGEDEVEDEMVVTKDTGRPSYDHVFSPKSPSKPFSIK